MNILIIINSLAQGGAERVVSRLSTHWALNNNVKILLFEKDNISYDYGGVLIPFRPKSSNRISKIFNRVTFIRNLLSRHKFDVVFSFMESSNFPTLLSNITLFNKSKIVVSVRNNPNQHNYFIRLLIKIFYNFAYKIVAVSEGVKQDLLRYNLSKSKLIAIPNPSPTLCYKDLSEKPFDFQYILGVGRLHRQKGFDMLLLSFSKIDNKNIKLVIIGEGYEEMGLKKLASTLEITERVIFLPNQKNVYKYYKYATLFVLSSRYEGWPNVVMESMACGCPVVAFDCNYGPNEIINSEVNGILVERENVNKLTYAIDKVLCDDQFRMNIINNAYLTMENFDMSFIAPKWLEL